MHLTVIDEAKSDVRDAAEWYDARARLGDAFVDEVVATLLSIERAPRRFSRVPKVRAESDVRRALLHRFPYAVVYELLPDRVRVVAVTHTARKPRSWRDRLGG